MKIITCKNYNEFSDKILGFFVKQALIKPKSNFLIPAGNTPLGFYKKLHAYEELFLTSKLFALDEYYGVNKKESFAFFFQKQLKNLYKRLTTFNQKLLNEAFILSDFENKIKTSNNIDLALLGLGENGHIAFNDPGSPYFSWTRKVNFSKANLNKFKHPANKAFTVGIQTILGSDKIILAVWGENKKQALKELLNNNLSAKHPATFLKMHKDLTIICDENLISQKFEIKNPKIKILDQSTYKKQNIIVISPHPDDSAISAGGTIYKLAKNNHITNIVMTSGHRGITKNNSIQAKTDLRKKESEQEAKLLNMNLLFLNLAFYESGKLNKQDIIKLSNLLLNLKANILIMPDFKDNHSTHKLSADLVKAAFKQNEHLNKDLKEIWFYESLWLRYNMNEYNFLSFLNKNEAKAKTKAIKAHKSQVSRNNYDEAALALNRLRRIADLELRLSGLGGKADQREKYVEVFMRLFN
ncbi:MAG: PIG-L family deacetylase [Pseudomonadota bacterium]